ncbi:MAG: S-layer homology domain-containing protein [Lawsonibacter sp.]|jgi:hypothetical protein|nr:S-layer homology domain-containing protein [Lawsonibacter sp.]
MKRILSAALALALLAMPWNGASAAESGMNFDFEEDDSGFLPIFADLPAVEGTEEFYELEYGHRDVPVEGAGKGLFLSGNNHSDDLFMGYYKELDGLTPGERYVFRVTFQLATDVESGMIGIGGSPGSSVCVKGGVTAQKPAAAETEERYYRLNLDKGNQSTGGADMAVIGDMEKYDSQRPGVYEFKSFDFTAEAVPGKDGRVYLILGTDSGFEGTSSWYVDHISVQWVEKRNETITRAEAVQLLYDAASAGPADGPAFRDVDLSSPYWYALGWAQSSGYISGRGGGCFAPNDRLTVEQAMSILYRYADSPEDILPMDLPGVSSWAERSMAWGLQRELIQEDGLTGHGGAIVKSAYVEALEKTVSLYGGTEASR